MKSVCSKLMMILLAVACCTLVSCKKEKVEKDTASTPTEEPTPTPTPTPTPVSAFIGTYDLEVVTDSLGSDGTWFSREYYETMTGKSEPPRYGRLTISQGNTDNTFHVIGKVLVGTDSVEYYNTTATLDANGCLILQPSYVANNPDDQFTYGKIQAQQPLVFRTERHVDWGMDFGYIMTNTATKRQ